MFPITREYICTSCYLCYDGYWDVNRGRQPCPHCACNYVHATDSFGSFYWLQGLEKDYGNEFIKNNFWYVPELISPERLEILVSSGFKSSNDISIKP